MRFVIALLVLAACRDDGVLHFLDTAGPGELAPPTIDVRLAPELGGGTARLPRTIGASIDAPFEGRRCTLVVAGLHTELDTSAPAHLKNPKSGDYRTRTYHVASLEARCTDGPAPGTPGIQRGGIARSVIPWLLASLVLGVLAGLASRWSEKSKSGGRAFAALGLMAVAVGDSIGFALWHFQHVFKLTIALLLGGFACAGIFAGHISERQRKTALASVLATLAGALGVILLHDAWTYGGPIIALLAAAGGWLATIVIATLATES